MNQNRKKLIVTPSVQYKIVWMICISVAIPILFLGGSILYNLYIVKGLIAGSNDILQFAVEQTISKTTMILVLGIPAVICLIICWSIVVTNRIAGPIHRLEMELDNIIKTRQFKEIHFRKHDAFHSLADKVNVLLGGIYGDNKSKSEYVYDPEP